VLEDHRGREAMSYDEAKRRCEWCLNVLRGKRFLGSFEKKIKGRLERIDDELNRPCNQKKKRIRQWVISGVNEALGDLYDLGLIELHGWQEQENERP